MKHLLLTLMILICLPVHAAIEGAVTKSGSQNFVTDAKTGDPIAGAKVSVPKQNFSTVTDGDGAFNLIQIDSQTLMSIDKDGYRPFSMTVDKNAGSAPVIVGIEKSNPMDIVLDTDLLHLGDDNYSESSANSGQFRAKALGPFYTKSFQLAPDALSRNNYLMIGSIIGVDTLMARTMGQNKIVNSYASPLEVFFNGSKVSEISLNGDRQQIKLPRNLIRPGSTNEITIKTGKNLMQTAYVDYDDIELMNLQIQAD
jgi:hypothetical protein